MTVTIRLINEEDIKTLYPLGNNKEISWMSGGGLTYPLSYDEFRSKKTIALSTAVGEMETYVIHWNDTAVGSIGYFRREAHAPLEIGYWIGKPYWGKGIASRALQLAIRAMRANGIRGTLIATTMDDNVGSRRMLLKCGFVETGTEIFASPAREMDVEGVHHELQL
jgi:RimJ/RimL family protein N-acetyltransferase